MRPGEAVINRRFDLNELVEARLINTWSNYVETNAGQLR